MIPWHDFLYCNSLAQFSIIIHGLFYYYKGILNNILKYVHGSRTEGRKLSYNKHLCRPLKRVLVKIVSRKMCRFSGTFNSGVDWLPEWPRWMLSVWSYSCYLLFSVLIINLFVPSLFSSRVLRKIFDFRRKSIIIRACWRQVFQSRRRVTWGRNFTAYWFYSGFLISGWVH